MSSSDEKPKGFPPKSSDEVQHDTLQDDRLSKIAEKEDLDLKESLRYKQGLAKGFVTLTVLNNLTVIGDFVVMLFASTVLTLDDIGLYHLLFQIIPLFTLFINYGFVNTSTKFVPYYDSKKEEHKGAAVAYFITLLNCMFAIVIATIMLIFSNKFSILFTQTDDYSHYIKLTAIGLIFVPNATINQLFVVRYKIGRAHV